MTGSESPEQKHHLYRTLCHRDSQQQMLSGARWDGVRETSQGRVMLARALACWGCPSASGTLLSRLAVTSILKVASCIPSRSIVSAFFRSIPSGSGFRSRRTVRVSHKRVLRGQFPSSHSCTYLFYLGLFACTGMERTLALYITIFPPKRGRAV